MLAKYHEILRDCVQDDLATIQAKWNALVKLVDAARVAEAENERLLLRAAEVGFDDVN